MRSKYCIALLFSVFPLVYSFSQKLIPVGEAYARTSVNTTVFRNNSLVTGKNDVQYIAFYDAEQYLVLGKRKSGTENWQLRRTQYKGNCEDAHNIISIMVDGDDYLHVSFDHHGHPLNYCRSLEPGSLQLGEKIPMTGKDEENVTYPEFYLLENGDLIFVYRSGASGRGNLVMNRYHLATQKWERVQDVLIDGEDQRNAYWQLYVDQQGTIHLSWVWRETWLVETNHDLCYARSRDGGRTWEKSDGQPYQLPINAGNAEYACLIPQNSELINQTSMTADNEGNPYIATYWREQNSDIPQYRLVYLNKGKWQQQQIFRRQTPFSLIGGGTKAIPIARPRIVIKQQEKRKEAYFIFRDEERGSKVSVAYTNDLDSGNWQLTDLTGFSVGSWEPGHDTELWKNKNLLHIYVQHSGQGDGEKTMEVEPQMVYVLEIDTSSVLSTDYMD